MKEGPVRRAGASAVPHEVRRPEARKPGAHPRLQRAGPIRGSRPVSKRGADYESGGRHYHSLMTGFTRLVGSVAVCAVAGTAEAATRLRIMPPDGAVFA